MFCFSQWLLWRSGNGVKGAAKKACPLSLWSRPSSSLPRPQEKVERRLRPRSPWVSLRFPPAPDRQRSSRSVSRTPGQGNVGATVEISKPAQGLSILRPFPLLQAPDLRTSTIFCCHQHVTGGPAACELGWSVSDVDADGLWSEARPWL
ncbi:unnamed protein product [Arctogadus glacialis]